MMAPAEFAAKAVGLPWVRWRSDWLACDCYGLVVLYWREVRGLDLGPVPRANIASGFAGLQAQWVECGPEPESTAWMAWREGAPTHCGVLLSAGQLLHAQEGPPGHGAARITRLTVMARLHSDIRFYKPAPAKATA